MAEEKDKQVNTESTRESPWHHRLALIIIVSSIFLIAGIVSCVFWLKDNTNDQASELILTSVLPLIGTWIGAVIAFYFSGKNL